MSAGFQHIHAKQTGGILVASDAAVETKREREILSLFGFGSERLRFL